MKIWVIIPAYNEGKRLGELLNQLKQRNLSVLVIDDGSGDNTFDVAQNAATAVIKNPRNLGKGMSLRVGIDHLIKNERFDCVITMDADGQHSPDDIDKFKDCARAGASFVVGNRMGDHKGMPWIRVITNRMMSWFISAIAGQKISDTQCGFRLIKRDVLEKINIKTKKFEMESEIIIKAAKMGVTINSIAIKSIYFKNQRSKINPLIDTIRFIRFVFGLRTL